MDNFPDSSLPHQPGILREQTQVLCVSVDPLLIQCLRLGSVLLACSEVRTAHPGPRGTSGRSRDGDLSGKNWILCLVGMQKLHILQHIHLPAARTSRHTPALVPLSVVSSG